MGIYFKGINGIGNCEKDERANMFELFNEDFMFQLEKTEKINRSQNVTLKRGQNIKYLPFAFTEQGVAMLSLALNIRRKGKGWDSGKGRNNR